MKLSQAIRDQVLTAVPALRAFAASLCGNVDRADDLVQETLLRAFTDPDPLKPGVNMAAWLFAILRNRLREEFLEDSRKRQGKMNDTNGHRAEMLKSHPEETGQVEFEERFLLAGVFGFIGRGQSMSVRGQTRSHQLRTGAADTGKVRTRHFAP